MNQALRLRFALHLNSVKSFHDKPFLPSCVIGSSASLKNQGWNEGITWLCQFAEIITEMASKKPPAGFTFVLEYA